MLTVLGLAAAILSTTVLWPQVRLSCLQRRTRGLPPAAAWLTVALNVHWLVFALLAGNPVQALTHVVVGAGNTAVLGALLLTRPELRTARALRANASDAAVAAVLGAVAGVAGVAAAVLPPLRLLRDRAQDTSGISPARWGLAASSLAWTAYGAGTGETVIWLSAGLDAVCALAVCALLQTRRPAVVVARRRVLAAA